MISLANARHQNAHLCRGQRNESATSSRPLACAAGARHLGGLARSSADDMTPPIASLAARQAELLSVTRSAAPGKSDGGFERLDPFEGVAEVILLDFGVKAGLEVEPEAVGGAEVAGQSECGVGRDPALAVDDLVGPARGHADRDGESVLADLQRL